MGNGPRTPPRFVPTLTTVVEPAPAAPAGPPTELPLARLRPGRYQPRTRMDETSLAELADSIREHGLMQPIVVRATEDDRYEIIAGERRFRAAAGGIRRTASSPR